MSRLSESDTDCTVMRRCVVCDWPIDRADLTRVSTVKSRDGLYILTLSQTEFRCDLHCNYIPCLTCDQYFDVNLLPATAPGSKLPLAVICPRHYSYQRIQRLESGGGLRREISSDQLANDL